MVTTARVDFVAAQMTILNAQKAATPTLLRAVWSSRPGNFNELPLAFIGNRDESLEWDAGTRTRTFNGLTVSLVDNFTDSQQDSDRMDVLVDLLVDRYNDAVQAVGRGSILELTNINDYELAEDVKGQITYRRAVLLTFARTFKKEGRA